MYIFGVLGGKGVGLSCPGPVVTSSRGCSKGLITGSTDWADRPSFASPVSPGILDVGGSGSAESGRRRLGVEHHAMGGGLCGASGSRNVAQAAPGGPSSRVGLSSMKSCHSGTRRAARLPIEGVFGPPDMRSLKRRPTLMSMQ